MPVVLFFLMCLFANGFAQACQQVALDVCEKSIRGVAGGLVHRDSGQ